MTTTRTHSKQTPREPRGARAGSPDPGARRLHVVTFGCQMNKYDSLLVEGRFKRRGWTTTEAVEDADVVLFNTCSVRDHAEERAYSWVGELKRLKEARPELVVGVMGCMAQRVEDDIFGRAGHVDLVCGTRQFHRVPELVDELYAKRSARAGGSKELARVLATGTDEIVAADRSEDLYDGERHAWLTVMRGCDLNCTFCIVPTVRGRVQSVPIADLVREAEWMVAQGAQVITLLGQTVNSYGEDFAPPRSGERRWRGRQGRPCLADLLHSLQEIEGLERIRLVTLHPAYVTTALAEALRDLPKVDRFLPVPLQSGSDPVLKAMKRGYTVDLYRRRMDMLREHVPNIELASDWIVGFPGETDADFDLSEQLLAEQGFVVNYVFKYDPRPGTSSSGRADDVPETVKKERNQRLLAQSEAVALGRLRSHIGQTERVFCESVSERDEKILRGRTLQGLPVSFAGGGELLGRTVEVAIEQATAYGMSGRVAERASHPR